MYTEWEQQRTSSFLASINRMCNRVPPDTRFNLQKLQSLNQRERNGGPFEQPKNRWTSTWKFLRRGTTRRSLIMVVVSISDLDARLFRFVNFYRDGYCSWSRCAQLHWKWGTWIVRSGCRFVNDREYLKRELLSDLRGARDVCALSLYIKVSRLCHCDYYCIILKSVNKQRIKAPRRKNIINSI